MLYVARPASIPLRQNAGVPCLAQLLCPHAVTCRSGDSQLPRESARLQWYTAWPSRLSSWERSSLRAWPTRAFNRCVCRLHGRWATSETALPCPTLLLPANGPVLPLSWPGSIHRMAAVRRPCWGRVIRLQDQSLHPCSCAAMQLRQLRSTSLSSIGCSQPAHLLLKSAELGHVVSQKQANVLMLGAGSS